MSTYQVMDGLWHLEDSWVFIGCVDTAQPGHHGTCLVMFSDNEDQVVEAVFERWRVDDQWQALERLLGAIPSGGTYQDVQFLPRHLMVPALRDVATLGWLEAGD